MHDFARHRRWGVLASLSFVLGAVSAQAAPGDHIRTGDTTIVPDIDLVLVVVIVVAMAAYDFYLSLFKKRNG